MGRKQKMPFSSSAYEVIVAVCIDYSRRKDLLNSDAISVEVKDTCHKLNNAVDAALEEIEPWIRSNMLKDIINRRGYDKTVIRLSKANYYKKKRVVIQAIGYKLNLF